MNNFNASSYFLDYSNVTKRSTEKQVTKGLEFILSHLGKPDWPRTISTKLTEGRQFTTYSRLEALSYFKDSNYLDCRISAYNSESKKTVNFIMIDLDQSNFKSMQELDRVKTKTLSQISVAFQVGRKIEIATVIWSGNGYHCYVPADSQEKILEQMSEFKKFKDPGKQFLRFAEWYLSNGKCDNEHNKTLSFNNCMLRIPGSFNSKNNVQVRIVQKWNGTSKVQLHLLYSRFLAYLVDQGQNLTKHAILSENGNLSQLSVLQRFYQRRDKSKKKFIPWIERLLKTPMPDHRKYCIWRILAPYLINVKHLSFEESFDRINQWLDKCYELEALDFHAGTKINDCLIGVINKGYLPISLDNPDKEPKTLKTDNRDLYDVVKDLVKATRNRTRYTVDITSSRRQGL
jgi:hypothetical protein